MGNVPTDDRCTCDRSSGAAAGAGSAQSGGFLSRLLGRD
jgi:hypothetical protein